MNLDDVVAQLLAGSLNEFTSARNAKAKELKAAGERDLAAEVARLKKPPVAVWAVNQLARRNKPVLERLRRAGEGVVQAQSGAVSGRKNAAPEVRSASEALPRELEAAGREAGAVETEKRIEMDHLLRTAKADAEAAEQATQTAHRLRDEADRIAADAKRAGERARQAEKELERASAKAKVSREAARRISPRRQSA